MGTSAGGRQVSVMGGASTPSAARGGRGKMRPVAHTPGQLAAAAAFVQAWQAPTPGARCRRCRRGLRHRRRSMTSVGRRRRSFDDERGTPSRRTLSFTESAPSPRRRARRGAPSRNRYPRRRPWRHTQPLALLACALASGRASFRRRTRGPLRAWSMVRGARLAHASCSVNTVQTARPRAPRGPAAHVNATLFTKRRRARSSASSRSARGIRHSGNSCTWRSRP